ncbi:MAG: GNAT family N-acetyltransferase [Eubacteriales bacterium]|nr:GNAT family N-acetyltransferase [Eubacteriales bacterium]
MKCSTCYNLQRPALDLHSVLNCGLTKQFSLNTERLLLRMPRKSDCRDLFLYAKDPFCSRYCLWRAHRSLKDSCFFINAMLKENRTKAALNFAVEEKSTGRMIGTIGFVSFSMEHSLAEVGYSFAPSIWGRGYATEALNKIVDYAFNTMELHRLEAQCDSRNTASARVLEKCGFKREGLMQKRLFLKDEYADILFYAMVNKNA